MKRAFGVVVAFGVLLVGASAIAVGGGAVATAAPGSIPPLPLPTVTLIPPGTGTHGYPYDAVPATPVVTGAPSINLAADGYVEQEYLMSGAANIYNESGTWGSNGQWNVSVAQSGVPYTTRLLVRYPTNPAKFNGTVVVEWMNDTTGGDQDPVWAQVYNELLANGFAYVGVTAQTPGMADLKTWDPVRYGSLGDTNDGQSYDIFTETAEAIRADSATLLGGLTPKEIIGTGDSQSALRVDTYVNAFQPLYHAYNAFIAVGRAGVDAPIGQGLATLLPFPAMVRTDNTAPFIQVDTQGDITELATADARQPDNTDLRTWEVSGASHIDTHEASYELETIYQEQPTVPVPECADGTPIDAPGTPLNGINQADNMPLYEVEDAAVADMQDWLAHGVAAPSERSTLSTTSFLLLYSVDTNQYGLASGGIQLPEAQVPTEDYSVENSAAASVTAGESTTTAIDDFLSLVLTGSIPITDTASRDSGLCALSGYFTPLPTSTLQQLYPTHADYVAKYTAAVEADESAGFLTAADGSAAIAAAQASSIP